MMSPQRTPQPRRWGLTASLVAPMAALALVAACLALILMPGDGLGLDRRKPAAAAAAVIIAGALGAGLRASLRIAGTLRTITGAVTDMAQGNYARRTEESAIPEVDALSGAVNHLAEQTALRFEALSHQAFHDPLTNLPNRTLFRDRLERALARAGRREDSVALIFIDLDNFKAINDCLGHHVGDEVLVEVSTRLEASLRPEDSIARLGGDEFTILLEDVANPGDATRVAERIVEHLHAPMEAGGLEVSVTASIGIAFLSTPRQDQSDALLQQADAAMYRAKSSGTVCEVFDPSMVFPAPVPQGQEIPVRAPARLGVQTG